MLMNVFLFVNGVVLILMDKLFVFTDNEKLVCSTFTAVISAQNISPDKAMDFEAYVKGIHPQCILSIDVHWFQARENLVVLWH